ncbi:MAG: HDOD domain-containing protein [Deltaproteobacteria bacterium]|nr:HDOD domain-containing protein [Deltaproteobacteria bacterium]
MRDSERRTLRYKIENLNNLPTIPAVLKKIIKLLENPKTSLSDIGNFVTSDPALTTKVLKMVNSPVYGFPGRISSVSQALVLLGLNVTKGLLLGVSVFELMHKTMTGLWEHSLACAICSKVIAKDLNLKDPEEVSIAGLLHDIGKVALALEVPEYYQGLMEEAKKKRIPLFQVEDEHFSFTHAQAGGWMTRKWNFPRTLVDVIEYHHSPSLSKVVPDHCAVVHVADVIVKARGFGYAGDFTVPPVNPAIWEKLQLNEEKILHILKRLDEDLAESEGTFE